MTRAPRWRAWLAERCPRLVLRFGPGAAGLSDDELGRLGEALAARALARSGWRLLGRRLRTPHGEIDLVAAMGGELVCVEVKTGRRRGSAASGLRFRPGVRLDARRLARHRRAGRWLAGRLGGPRLRGGRVDLVEVLVHGSPVRWEVIHHRDVERPLADS